MLTIDYMYPIIDNVVQKWNIFNCVTIDQLQTLIADY